MWSFYFCFQIAKNFARRSYFLSSSATCAASHNAWHGLANRQTSSFCRFLGFLSRLTLGFLLTNQTTVKHFAFSSCCGSFLLLLQLFFFFYCLVCDESDSTNLKVGTIPQTIAQFDKLLLVRQTCLHLLHLPMRFGPNQVSVKACGDETWSPITTVRWIHPLWSSPQICRKLFDSCFWTKVIDRATFPTWSSNFTQTPSLQSHHKASTQANGKKWCFKLNF